jgi:pimeloyl-ACP methyl ester carboxylesterase
MMSNKDLITTEGIRIAYDVIGQGPALMLLHGAGKTRKDWKKVGYVERLKDEFKIINVDIRGSG